MTIADHQNAIIFNLLQHYPMGWVVDFVLAAAVSVPDRSPQLLFTAIKKNQQR